MLDKFECAQLVEERNQVKNVEMLDSKEICVQAWDISGTEMVSGLNARVDAIDWSCQSCVCGTAMEGKPTHLLKDNGRIEEWGWLLSCDNPIALFTVDGRILLDLSVLFATFLLR